MMTFGLYQEEGHLTFSPGARPGTLFIDILWIDEEARRHGKGSELLRTFLALADHLGAEVHLDARSDIGYRPIVAFYQKHGFKLQEGTPEWINRMIRTPQKADRNQDDGNDPDADPDSFRSHLCSAFPAFADPAAQADDGTV